METNRQSDIETAEKVYLENASKLQVYLDASSSLLDEITSGQENNSRAKQELYGLVIEMSRTLRKMGRRVNKLRKGAGDTMEKDSHSYRVRFRYPVQKVIAPCGTARNTIENELEIEHDELSHYAEYGGGYILVERIV
jgi:hypothetical protein